MKEINNWYIWNAKSFTAILTYYYYFIWMVENYVPKRRRIFGQSEICACQIVRHFGFSIDNSLSLVSIDNYCFLILILILETKILLLLGYQKLHAPPPFFSRSSRKLQMLFVSLTLWLYALLLSPLRFHFLPETKSRKWDVT